MKTAYIYGLSSEDGIIRYVGKTSNLNKRLNEHRRLTGKSSHKNNWIASVLTRGGSLQIHSLEEVPHDDIDAWVAAEEFWIKYLKFLGCPLTNTFEKSLAGWDRSPEFGQRIAERNRRRPNEVNERISKTLTGRKLSEEHKQKFAIYAASEENRLRLSALHKGKVLNEAQKRGLDAGRSMERTPEYRAKVAAALKGNLVRSEEWKRKQSLAHKGAKRAKRTPEQIASLTMRREATKILKILQSRQLI